MYVCMYVCTHLSHCSHCVSIFCLVAPGLITEPVDQTVTESENVTFHCNAIGNPTPKISWMKDGKTVAEGKTLSFETNRNQSGKYWCLAENGLNSTVNASATLDVQCKLVKHYKSYMNYLYCIFF